MSFGWTQDLGGKENNQITGRGRERYQNRFTSDFMTLDAEAAKRPFDDKMPELQSHRQKELQDRQKLYRWKLWKPGVTKCIEAETEADLHPDVKFDDDKRADFKHSFYVAIGELFLKKFVNMFGDSWDSLESFQRIFWRVKSVTG
eukprot:g31459.t1